MAPIDISTRSLQKGSAEFLVLSILDGPDRHGYELAQIIENRSDGRLLQGRHLIPLALPARETRLGVGPLGRKSRRWYRKWKGSEFEGSGMPGLYHDYVGPIDRNYDPLIWRIAGLLGHAMALSLEEDGRSGTTP